MVNRIIRYWLFRLFMPGRVLKVTYGDFRQLLDGDSRSLEIIADLQDIFYSVRPMDRARVTALCLELCRAVGEMIECLQRMHPGRYRGLTERFASIADAVKENLRIPEPSRLSPYVLPLEECAGKTDLAGGKAANLARVATETDLPVPAGFVVTTRSFHHFIEDNGLRPLITDILNRMEPAGGDAAFDDACLKLRELVRGGKIPDVVAKAMDRELALLCGDRAVTGIRFAVRSSAWAEDGESSFAGQYDTLLDVSLNELKPAYREVLASKYSPRAVTYRMLKGLSDEETPMAVLVLPMVEARAAGVAYTEDSACEACISVHAGPGPGDDLVAGRVNPDVYYLKKADPPEIIGLPDRDESLGRDRALDVAAVSLALERVFGVAQDVEWIQDREGRIWVLQSRPFHGDSAVGAPVDIPDSEPFLSGLTTISMGVACGPIFPLHRARTVGDVPRGCVALFAVLSPHLTGCLDRVSAVIGMSGGRASHFATVAREFGVPVVVGDKTVLDDLQEGAVVTVDASRGSVFMGCVGPAAADGGGKPPRERRPFSSCYKKLIPWVTRLNITDPYSPNFRPDRCGSLHDIVRYVHEKGMEEMFFLGGQMGRGLRGAKKLETDLPLALYVLNLQDPGSKGRRKMVKIEDTESAPLQALWEGLETANAHWESGVYHADWETLDRISGGIFTKDAQFLSSYVLVSRDYMHMMVRFGYHFSVLDALCSSRQETNYISFRFKGGGGGSEGRRFRLRFIRAVLEPSGFEVKIKGDMLDARIARMKQDEVRRFLWLLGGLLAQTRLLDMRLETQAQAEDMAEAYLESCRLTQRPISQKGK
jgi:pyruvate,water dikinase